MSVVAGPIIEVTNPVRIPGSARLAFEAESMDKNTSVDVKYEVLGGANVRIANADARNITVRTTRTVVSHEARFTRGTGPLPDTFEVRGSVTEGGTFRFAKQWRIRVAKAAMKVGVKSFSPGGGPGDARRDTNGDSGGGAPARKRTARKGAATKRAAKKGTAKKGGAKKGTTKRGATKKRGTRKGTTARTSNR